MMKTVLLLVNPLIEQRAPRRRDLLRVQQTFRAAGVEVNTKETLPGHTTGDLVRRSLSSAFDAVIVCGGDGTIFDALQGVAGTPMPIGVIPFGTGNILAQNLGIPKDPVQAVEALLRSRRLTLPLGRVTCAFPGEEQRSWFFMVAAGLGIHASLMGASKAWSKRIAGPAAYYAAGIDLLLRQRIAPFEMETTDADGRVEIRQCCEAIGVRVAELNRWRPGGHLGRPFIRIISVAGASRAALARAVFHVLVHRSTEAAGGLRNGAASSGDFVRAVFRPVEGFAYLSPVQVEADGELLGASTATVEMAAERVTLLSPENHL